MFDKIIENTINAAKQNIPSITDYEKDGLMYCGKCHTPKQYVAKMPTSDIEIKVDCLCKCMDEEYKRKEVEREKAEMMYRIESMRAMGIKDAELRACRFSCDLYPSGEKALNFKNYCDKWETVKKDNIGLLLFGNVGTGKTFYASCILNEVLEKYAVSVKATSLPELMNGIYSAQDKNSYIADNIKKPELLLIDDLGTQRDTSYSQELIYEIIDERYKTKKPTIFTTNLSYSYIKNATDENEKRVFDRILEMCVPVEFNGESIRKLKAGEKLKQAKEILLKKD